MCDCVGCRPGYSFVSLIDVFLLLHLVIARVHDRLRAKNAIFIDDAFRSFFQAHTHKNCSQGQYWPICNNEYICHILNLAKQRGKYQVTFELARTLLVLCKKCILVKILAAEEKNCKAVSVPIILIRSCPYWIVKLRTVRLHEFSLEKNGKSISGDKVYTRNSSFPSFHPSSTFVFHFFRRFLFQPVINFTPYDWKKLFL